MGKILSNGVEYSGVYDKASSVTYDNSTSGLSSTTVQDAIDELVSKDKKVYHITQMVDNVPNADYELCRLTLPKGHQYLILGQCYSNYSANIDYSLSISGSTYTTFSRMTTSHGGGCNCWGYQDNSSSDTTVILSTYGYSTSGFNMYGKLFAVELS